MLGVSPKFFYNSKMLTEDEKANVDRVLGEHGVINTNNQIQNQSVNPNCVLKNGLYQNKIVVQHYPSNNLRGIQKKHHRNRIIAPRQAPRSAAAKHKGTIDFLINNKCAINFLLNEQTGGSLI